MAQRLHREKSGTVVIFGEKIKFQDLIGHGGYGQVYRADHVDWGEVAVKKFCEADDIMEKDKKKLIAEAEKMWDLGHANVVRIYGIMLEKKNYSIVLELMRHGSLVDFLEDYEVTMPMKAQIIHQTILGMNYLHTRDPAVFHLDLKGQNILISTNFDAKICDFGLAQWRSLSEKYSMLKREGLCGTATHIPPESWKNINSKPTNKFDVYSFAILLWEILTQKQPFETASAAQISTAVVEGQRPDELDLPKDTTPIILEILKRCWCGNPDDRPTFGDLKNSFEDFFKRKYDSSIPDAKINLLQQVKQKNVGQTKRKQVVVQEEYKDVGGDMLSVEHPDREQSTALIGQSGIQEDGTGSVTRQLGEMSTIEMVQELPSDGMMSNGWVAPESSVDNQANPDYSVSARIPQQRVQSDTISEDNKGVSKNPVVADTSLSASEAIAHLPPYIKKKKVPTATLR